VTPLPVPHDAAQVALVVAGDGRRALLATDLGEVPPGLPALIDGCDIALLESNHDPAMLARGPYPEHLKRRIASSKGHLSNAQTHAVLARLGPRVRAVVLMHLSRTNNAPELALAVAADALAGRGVRLLAASQDDPLALDVEASPPRRAPPRGRDRQLELPFA
jgi:phosphoribosyl 1,2-cyclic phosphodiesterase